MDVTVTVRHCEIPERFRRHLVEKVGKVEQLAPRSRRLAAVVRHEPNPRLAPVAYRLELTVYGDGPVVRAEASADEPYAALDLAFAKVVERLRRAHDRRVVRRGRSAGGAGRSAAVDVGAPLGATTDDETTPLRTDSGAGRGVEARADQTPPRAGLAGDDAAHDTGTDTDTGADIDGDADADGPWADGTSPISIREKTHSAEPMTLDQALYEMELVGHDFFLFVDAGNGLPSVVYRRKGWSYGVIRLAARLAEATPSEAPAPASSMALVD